MLLPACSAQWGKKAQAFAEGWRWGVGVVRCGRVKQDSKRELLTLDTGCTILKAAEFAHRVSYSWKPSACPLSKNCKNIFQHQCKAASP